MNEIKNTQVRTSNRIKIIAVAVIFLAPVVIATALKLIDWHPTRTGNHGELVQPARPLPDLKFSTLDGAGLTIIDARHQWLIVTFGTNDCDKYCEANIYKMRQSHISMGKYYKRVRRLLVLPNKPGNKLLIILKNYPDMAVSIGPGSAIRELGKQLYTKDGTALDGLNRIYLVDPLGNFMMTYDKNADAADLRKDLRRLLRVSRIG